MVIMGIGRRDKMKKGICFLLLSILTLLSVQLCAEVKVSAEMEESGLYENLPLKGMITISRPSGESIAENSFMLNNAPLAVDKVNEVKMTAEGDLVLSMYRFELKPQPKGLHALGSITVKVGGKEYRTNSTTYEVLPMSPTAVVKEPGSSQEVFLKLEAFVNGPTTLFPGQKTFVGYRYIFNGNIETTVENTPLLDAKGLVKVGDKIIKKAEQGDLSILQITQIVQGDKPGEYTYGPSILEGFAYDDSSGKRVYSKKKLSTVVAPITITVKPYPVEGKPASFNGVIGNYTWKSTLVSPPKVSVGDEMEISIEASGKGNLDTLNLPELCCQPEMSGLFRLSDLPPVGKVEGETKRFDVKLTPLSTSAKEIPSLEFSSFDPDTQKYVVSHTEPIPISVTQLTPPASAPSQKNLPPAAAAQPDWKKELVKTTPIEIQKNEPLSRFDLFNLPFGTWWSLLLIPFGIGLLIFQRNLIIYLEQAKKEVKTKNSGEIFEEAVKAQLGSPEQYSLLNRAFLLKLKEIGELDTSDIAPEQLPQEGVKGEVRAFLQGMEANRYAGKGKIQNENLLRSAKELFDRLGRS